MPTDRPHVKTIIDRIMAADLMLAKLDLTAVSPNDLPQITQAVRRVQNRCTAATIAIAKQARVVGDDPDATLLGRGNVSGSTARKEAERANTTEAMPDLDDAVSSGDISGEHLDAISRARKGLSEAERIVFDQLAAELAEIAANLPVDTFKRRLRTIIDNARKDHGLTRLQQQRAKSGLKMWEDADGMGHTHITADAERHAKLRSAIERHAATLAAAAKKNGESVAMGPSLNLDALIDLLEHSQGDLGRPTITIIVDDETLRNGPHDHTVCETEAGVDLPVSVVERHLCDSVTQTVRYGPDGLPLDVGRRYRTATSAQWVALKSMYRTCAWKGCCRPVTWCQAHHIKEWEHGGLTNLDNLIPLCSKHHHAVHEGGWRVKLHPDRTLEIFKPSDPPGSHPGGKPGGHHRARSGAPPNRPKSPPADRGPSWTTTRPDRRPARQHATPAQTTPDCLADQLQFS